MNRRGARARFAPTLILLALSGCQHAPMSYLATSGRAVDPLTRLGLGLIALSLVVVLVIFGLLAWAIWHRRPPVPEGADARALLGRGASGLAFITIGVGISTVALFAFTIWSLAALAAVVRPPHAPRLTIQVTGHQFWWEIRYLDADGRGFITANEIHVPVGEPVRVELSSADVIHSFWVPKLAGKMQMIPGQTNATWLQADAPGVYRGQCTQLCGLQHAHMAMLVIADPAPAFTSWWNAQLAEPRGDLPAMAAAGRVVFQARCAACHTVRGTTAGGLVGPDLSHVHSRRTLAADTLPNDADHLAAWIADPQAAKPGNIMPNVGLESGDSAAVVAYLQTLD